MNYIPIVSLLLFFFLYQKKCNHKFDIVSYLFVVYIFMGAMSIIIHITHIFPSIFEYSLESMAYLSICFIIIFLGFFNFNNRKFLRINISNFKYYTIIEKILIFGGFGAIIFFMPFALSGLKGDVKLNRMLNSEFQETVLASYGIINSLFSLFSNLFIVMLLFSFIDFSCGKKKKGYLLFISSFSYVIYILAYVGRDGVVYWIMSFIFIYLLMKDFLAPNFRQKIKKLTITLIPLLLVPFIIISIARFYESDYGVIGEIVNYSGQQIKNFNDSYQVNAPITYGRKAFPLFTDWLSKLGFIDRGEKAIFDYENTFSMSGVPTWVFKTYIGSFLVDFGKIGTLIILIFIAIISRNIINKVNKTETFNIENLLIFILLYQTTLWGVFYNRLSSANLYILIIIMLYFLFKLKSSSRSIIINKL